MTLPATRTALSQTYRQLTDLPGPRSLPVVGNMHQLNRTRLHQDMENWSREFGSLFRVELPRATLLVVSDPEIIKQVLTARPSTFRRPAVMSEVAQEMGGIPGVFDAEGIEWRNQRKMVMQAFAPQAVKSYFPAMLQVAQRLQHRWEAAAVAQKTINLGADLRLYTVDIVAGLAFGCDVNTIEKGDNAIQRDLDQFLPAVARRSLAPFAYWRYVKLPRDYELERCVDRMRVAVSGLVVEAKDRMRNDPSLVDRPRNMLEAMLAAAAREDSGVSERDVAGNVLTMLLAGEDTTSNSLAWLIYLLHRHPEVLHRARVEILRIVPDVGLLSIEQIDQLDFIEACANEALRLKPPAPSMPVEALVDTVVGDVQIEAGTVVWCVMRNISQDNAWSANSAQFDPQRWYGDAIDKKTVMSFGAGPRTCPGRYLALLEIKVAIVTLIAKFDILSVATVHGGEPQEVMGFVMEPETLHMQLRIRE